MEKRESSGSGARTDSEPIPTPLPAAASRLIRFYDWLDRFRKTPRVTGPLTTLLIVIYLASLATIEVRRLGWLPEPLASMVSPSRFLAIGIAFYLLVLAEVVGLIFGLSESVARSIGKELEILSLILLRQSFEILSELDEPIRWTTQVGKLSENRLVELVGDAIAALVIFVLVGFYYRLQHKQPISQDSRDQQGFIDSKKLVALLLLVGLSFITVRGALDYLRIGGKSSLFFEDLFSLLIFSDVLIVLISLRYSATYRVVFRNSAFALATVLIRLALTAPPLFNALMGLVASLYTIGLTLAYNEFAPTLREAKVAAPPEVAGPTPGST